MPDPYSALGAAALGGIAGFAGSKKDSGRDAGNALRLNAQDEALAQGQLGALLRYSDNPDIVDPIKGSNTATDQVQNNAILGQLFGKNGTLSRTVGEEQDLASRGYSLRPEDHEAYGQMSGELARQFGAQEGNLAQALSNRGLSQSTTAGQAFSGLQGNKFEQLAKAQRQIADSRMQSNMQRLAQTRQFLGQMGQQAGNEIEGQYQRQMQGANTMWSRMMDKNNAAQSRLMGMQQQGNEQLGQRQATAAQPGWASALGGMSQAGMSALGASGGGSPMAQQKKPQPGMDPNMIQGQPSYIA